YLQDGKLIGFQLVSVYVYFDLTFLTTQYFNGGHTLYARKLRFDLFIDQVIELSWRHVSSGTHLDDREVVQVKFVQCRRIRIFRQPGQNGVDLALRFL